MSLARKECTLNPGEADELADAWVEYETHRRKTHHHKMGSVDEALLYAAASKPAACWQVVSRILDMTDDDELLSTIGAGILEDLLAVNGRVVISRIEDFSQRCPGVAEALKYTGKYNIPEVVWQRVRSVVQTS